MIPVRNTSFSSTSTRWTPSAKPSSRDVVRQGHQVLLVQGAQGVEVGPRCRPGPADAAEVGIHVEHAVICPFGRCGGWTPQTDRATGPVVSSPYMRSVRWATISAGVGWSKTRPAPSLVPVSSPSRLRSSRAVRRVEADLEQALAGVDPVGVGVAEDDGDLGAHQLQQGLRPPPRRQPGQLFGEPAPLVPGDGGPRRLPARADESAQQRRHGGPGGGVGAQAPQVDFGRHEQGPVAVQCRVEQLHALLGCEGEDAAAAAEPAADAFVGAGRHAGGLLPTGPRRATGPGSRPLGGAPAARPCRRWPPRNCRCRCRGRPRTPRSRRRTRPGAGRVPGSARPGAVRPSPWGRTPGPAARVRSRRRLPRRRGRRRARRR